MARRRAARGGPCFRCALALGAWRFAGGEPVPPPAAIASATTAAAMARRSAYFRDGERKAAEWTPQFRGPAARVAAQTRATYRPASAVSAHATMPRQYTLSALRGLPPGLQWPKIAHGESFPALTGSLSLGSKEAAECPRTTTF